MSISPKENHHLAPLKIWLTRSGGCVVANNAGRIPQSDLNELMEIISAQFFLICRKWKEHFCVEEIQFFC